MEGVCAWGWSPHLRILMCCCLAALCWSPGALGMLEVVTADESRSPFPNLTDIVVGRASDVIVTVRCVATPVRTVMWRYTGNNSLVPMGLQPFGASQEDGVLRIYPATLLEQVNQYTCSGEGTAPLPVQFRLASDLFFTGLVPPTISVGTNVTAVCPIPDIPQSTVTAENPLETDDITYCNVVSERGVFRSRSVTVIDPMRQVPTYRIEPVNITARPIGGNTRAAFSCSITPDQNLASIQWYFEPMEFGSRMGPLMMDSRFLSSGSGVTIEGGLADPGTSILVLDGVGNDNEGYYSCVASFSDGITVNSSRGVLIYDATASNADTIILDLPNILTVMAGEAVTIPCVTSGSQQPTFMFGTSVPSGTQNQYSLDFTSITPAAGGEYMCQVGATTSTFTIDVLDPLTFSVTLQAEYIQTVGDNGMSLRCQAGGNPSPGQPIWQRNGVRVAAETGRVSFVGGNTILCIRTVQEGDAGIYQCLVAVDNQPATTIVQSSYLNVYFLRDIAITINPSVQQIILELPSTPPTITLNCSVIAHPIPWLEWTRNRQPVVGQQAATGHMETPFSLLTVATSELTNGVESFTCTANLEMNNPISYAINITSYSLVIITEDPQSTVPLLLGETAFFICHARSIPFPIITWFRLQNNTEIDNGDDITIVSQQGENFTTSSVLSMRVTGEEDFTGFFCVGDNGFDTDTSTTAQLVQAGVPGAPRRPTVSHITSREALLSWVPVVSTPQVTQYNVTWVCVDTGVSISITVDADVAQLLLTNLRPNCNYTVTVVAINRVGEGPLSEPADFTTLENAPDAAPTNVSTTSTLLNQIDVSWNPPPEECQNGVIIRYLVRYADIAAPSMVTVQTATTTSASLTMAISAGTTYLVSIAAVTRVGDGPFSGNVSQQTLSVPPPFSGEPSQSPDMPVTSTTIPITLPTIPSLQEYSHFWVIALIVTNEIDTTRDPTELFPDNSTFTTYSNIQPGVPYIVAEIDSANYPATFVLGDDDNRSTSVNDFPELYRNGPLTPGTSYTVFVWGFAPSVPPGSTVFKRQSLFMQRQYISFTSTRYSYILVTTIVVITGGITAADLGGAIGAVCVLLIVLSILIVVVILVQRTRKRTSPNSVDETYELPQLPASDASMVKYNPSYGKAVTSRPDHIVTEINLAYAQFRSSQLERDEEEEEEDHTYEPIPFDQPGH